MSLFISILAMGLFLYLIIRTISRSVVLAAYSAKELFLQRSMALSFCIGLLLSQDTEYSVFTSKDCL